MPQNRDERLGPRALRRVPEPAAGMMRKVAIGRARGIARSPAHLDGKDLPVFLVAFRAVVHSA